MLIDSERDMSIGDIRHGDKRALFQQGKPVLPSDINSSNAMLEHQREVMGADVIGRYGFPKSRAGFAVRADSSGRMVLTQGHAYLDGVLIENERTLAYDIVEEMTGSQQHVVILGARKLDYTYLIRDEIRDPALGGIDTTARSRCESEILVLPLATLLSYSGVPDKDTFLEYVRDGVHVPTPLCGFGDAAARITTDDTAARPDEHCLIRDDAEYLGQENANYRIEIHHPSSTGRATFKFARHCIQGRLSQNDGGDFVVHGSPEDDLVAFYTGQAVEVRDAAMRRTGRPGVLGTITVNADGTYGLSSSITSAVLDFSEPVIIIGWHHDPVDFPDGIPITGTSPIPLENGIQVEFRGDQMPGDHWERAARIQTGTLLPPPYETPDGFIGSYSWRRCVPLALIRRSGGGIVVDRDIRNLFPDLTHLDARDVTFVSDACGATTGRQTVHDALESICARMDRDGCKIRVRPHDHVSLPGSPYKDVGTYPTLADVVETLGGFLKETDTPQRGRRFLTARLEVMRRERRGRLIPDFSHGAAFHAVQPTAALTATVLGPNNLRDGALARRPNVTIPEVAADGVVGVFEPAGAADILPDSFAAPDDNPHLNRYFLDRRVCLELLPGTHVWPAAFAGLLKNMSDVTIKGCCSGNATLELEESLVLDRCVAVRLENLNIIAPTRESQIAIKGGKSVHIDDVVVTRRVSGTTPICTLEARTRIAISDARFRLTHGANFGGLALGLHIAGCRAFTTLEKVQSNGYLVLGEGVIEPDSNPIVSLLNGARERALRPSNFRPFNENTLSNNSVRIVDCRLLGVLPGERLANALVTFGGSGSTRVNELPFLDMHVDRCEFTEGLNIFVARNVVLTHNRFFQQGRNTAVAGNLLVKLRKISTETKSAFDELVSSASYFDPDNVPAVHPWSVVGVSIGRTVMHRDNQGSAQTAGRDERTTRTPFYSALVEVSERNDAVSSRYELEHRLCPMLLNRLFSLHSGYLRGRS